MPGNPSRPPFRHNSQQSGPQKSQNRYDGLIYLPPQIFKLLSPDAMKALKAFNTEAINRFHQRKVYNTKVVEHPQEGHIKALELITINASDRTFSGGSGKNPHI